MKMEINFGLGLLVLVGAAGLGVSPTVHAQTFSGDGDTLESEPIVVRIEEGEAFSPAGITVDVAGDDFLGLTATDRKGVIRLLDFIPNETTGDWAPVPDDVTTPGVFGADPQLWLFSMLVAGEDSERIELEPLDRTIADVPHDDVTVLVVDETLTLVVLWDRGTVVGVYYAVNTDTETTYPTEGMDGAAAVARTPKERVCDKLLNTCLGELNTHWVLSCGLWLYFCSAV